MDRNVLQLQSAAVRDKRGVFGLIASVRSHKDTVRAVLPLDQRAVPAEADRIETHLVAAIKRKTLVITEAGFLKLPELFIGENDYLFNLKTGFPFRLRLQRRVPFEVFSLAGAVIEHSVFPAGFRFFQGNAFFRYTPQIYIAVIPAVAKVQGVFPLCDQHILCLPLGPYHEAAEQAARIGAHKFPIVFEEGIFRRDVL